MTRKKKKWLTVVFILLAAVILFLYKTEYKLPLGDRHKNWPTLENYTNNSYVIKRTLDPQMIASFGDKNRYLCLDTQKLSVIDSTGRILRVFKVNEKDILYDSLMNRILIPKISNGKIRDRKINDGEYIGYDLTTFTANPVKVVRHQLKETYPHFLKRKGITLPDAAEQWSAYVKQDSIYRIQYRLEMAKEIELFNSLYPVVEKGKYPEMWAVKYYTDRNGTVYDIVKNNREKDPDSIGNFYDALSFLFPGMRTVPVIYNDRFFSPNIYAADYSRATDNTFIFSIPILISPTGGGGGHIKMYFDQNFINYYTIKLKDSALYFKLYEKVDVVFPPKITDDFKQLNIPRSDQDTLAFFSHGDLYRVYPRRK